MLFEEEQYKSLFFFFFCKEVRGPGRLIMDKLRLFNPCWSQGGDLRKIKRAVFQVCDAQTRASGMDYDTVPREGGCVSLDSCG